MEPKNEETSVQEPMSVQESMDSKFRYVLLVAQRAEQLMRGARPKLDTEVSKPTTLAKEEVDRNLIEWDYGPAPQPELEALGEVAEEPEEAEAEVEAPEETEADPQEEVH